MAREPGTAAHDGYPEDGLLLARVLLRSRSLLAVAIAVTIVLAIVAATSPDWLARIDEPISEWIRGDGQGKGLFSILTHLGSPNLSLAVAGVAMAMLWRRCRASALVVGALVTAAIGIDILVKIVVARSRPDGALVGTALGSFPSGHVIHAVIVFGFTPFLLWAFTRHRWLVRAGTPVFVFAVSAVGVTRVRLGAHWPSDIVASFFIGLTLLLLAERLLTSAWAEDRCHALGLHQRSRFGRRDSRE